MTDMLWGKLYATLCAMEAINDPPLNSRGQRILNWLRARRRRSLQ